MPIRSTVEPSCDDEREVSTVVVERVLQYTRRLFGDDAVERVLDLANLGDRRRAVTEVGGWCSLEELTAVAMAAEGICGDRDLGRRIGEENFHDQLRNGTADFLRDTGSMGTVIELTVDFSGKMSALMISELLEVGPNHAEFAFRSRPGAAAGPRYQFTCGIVAGYFGQLPSLFGSPGAIAEVECRHRGDDRCRFRLVWDDPPEHTGTPPQTPLGARTGAVEWFEQLQALAAQMVVPEDVDVILERVVQNSGAAVLAHQVVLLVDLPGERTSRVHHVGLVRAEVTAMADSVRTGTIADRPEALRVPISSAQADFGWLVAVFPTGSTPNDYERRMLSAYANLATAALESAVTLSASRRDQATAEALFDLARSLIRSTDVDEIARRLVEAAGTVTGADRIAVWLAEPGAAGTRLVASEPGLLDGDPRIDGTEEVLAGCVDRLTAPVTAHGRDLGVLAIGFAETRPSLCDRELADRLQSLADQGAAALANVRLIDEVRHQALHDALTGLPGRRLMEDRAEAALSAATAGASGVGLLFVDLDRFKEINDDLGHAAGDELLRAVSRRFTDCLRASDTLSRHGGDEFVVLLADVPTRQVAEEVARKLIAAAGRPFDLDGRSVSVSASVGVAAGGATYDELCHTADVTAVAHARRQVPRPVETVRC
jgi:diguanylate cyclase (GGDEF)-like protein